MATGACGHLCPHASGKTPSSPCPSRRARSQTPSSCITALVADSCAYVVCPWSTLLSAAGSLSFQDHVSHLEAAPFKAPELLQGQSEDDHPDTSQVRGGAGQKGDPSARLLQVPCSPWRQSGYCSQLWWVVFTEAGFPHLQRGSWSGCYPHVNQSHGKLGAAACVLVPLRHGARAPRTQWALR